MKNRQTAELVVRALLRAAMQALHNIDIRPIDVIERTRLMFAVLEFAFLVTSKRLLQGRRNPQAQIFRGTERKNDSRRTMHPDATQ